MSGALDRVRIGTRGSRLALWQAHHIRDRFAEGGVTAELVVIKTQGDKIQDVPFSAMPGKGFFTKELEDAQLDGRVDLAVHSMKDLMTVQPPGLALGALVGRADARDVLLAMPHAAAPASQPLPLVEGARVGTSSARRQAQLRALRPDVQLGDLRGNVPTRVAKLRSGDHDAIVLAAAGLDRLALDLDGLVVTRLAPAVFVPAPAQGMLALQCRDEPALRALLATLHSADAAPPVEAERWLLAKLEGGCQLPFGAYCGPADGGGHELTVFLERDGDVLRFAEVGDDPQALAERAWARISA